MSKNHSSPSPGPMPSVPREAKKGLLDDPGEMLNAALPWAISLVFHIFLFLLMFLVVWAVQEASLDDDLPISTASLDDFFEDSMNAEMQNPELQVAQNAVQVQSQQDAKHQIDLLREVAVGNDSEVSIIGIGAGVGGGELATFGLSAGSLGEGPSFFGLGKSETKARKICYVVDRSGSMIDELDFVKDEVQRSINRLHRVQQFHIIFFSGGAPVEAPPGRFVHAIKNYKRGAFQFLSSIEAAGRTDPIPAMARAFSHEPDLIYFLTDGEFTPELVDRLRAWNQSDSVRIYTIAFLRNDGEDLLLQIAKENGGEYRFVSLDELE